MSSIKMKNLNDLCEHFKLDLYLLFSLLKLTLNLISFAHFESHAYLDERF